MIVRCITNTKRDLSMATIEIGYQNVEKFNIKIDETYFVYGVSIWKGVLEYLISEKETDKPIWCPAELFEVVSKLIPIIWYFNFEKYKNYKGEESTKVIIGYKELVENDEYYAALAEEQKEALDIFIKRKNQIDEYESDRQK